MTYAFSGYITWHLSDPRYRLRDLTANVSGSGNSVADQFCRYQASADRVGAVDPKEWAYPSVVELVEQRKARRDSMGAGSAGSSPKLQAQD
jgi:ABC-type thiamine transport system substrate-binding protein